MKKQNIRRVQHRPKERDNRVKILTSKNEDLRGEIKRLKNTLSRLAPDKDTTQITEEQQHKVIQSCELCGNSKLKELLFPALNFKISICLKCKHRWKAHLS